MIRLLPRTETKKDVETELYIQCDIGYDEETESGYESCSYCRYKNEATTWQDFLKCRVKHSCFGAAFPWIRFVPSIDLSLYDPVTHEVITDKWYQATNIFKQVEFEAQPLRVMLCTANNIGGHCNANCWWHGWRLANKKTWRQCGRTHLCGNDGSFYNLMVPEDDTLKADFYDQF